MTSDERRRAAKARRHEPRPAKVRLIDYHNTLTHSQPVALPPPLSVVTGVELARAARRAARAGGLRQAEAAAISYMVSVVGARGNPFVLFRRAFRALACATTPDRAEDLALWSPFDPKRLREECRRCQARKTA